MNATAAETLNDLILVNNDRIQGYQRAIRDTAVKDDDLKAVFKEMIDQSQLFNRDLIKEVEAGGFMAETETSVSGKMHRAWIDIKLTFSGNSRKSLLAECEKGEDAAKEVYSEALHEDNGLSNTQRELVAEQATALQLSHTQIKALRDAAIQQHQG